MRDATARAKIESDAKIAGVEVGVESGALTTFLVQGTGTGNIKVTLEWEREKDEK